MVINVSYYRHSFHNDRKRTSTDVQGCRLSRRSYQLFGRLGHCLWPFDFWYARFIDSLLTCQGWKRDKLTVETLKAAENPVTFMNDLYVRISQESKVNKEVKEGARKWSKALEDGDPEARKLWELFREVSLAEFKRVYELLGVDFDSWKGEAYYADKMGPVLKELEDKNLLTESDGKAAPNPKKKS